MTLWSRIGLRGRLGLALAAVAIVSVALATVLADRGLHSRLDQFAQDRLQAAATHSAELAAGFYGRQGRWTTATATQLAHLAEMNGYRIAINDAAGRPVGAARPVTASHAQAGVVVGGRRVGAVVVAPLAGQVLTGEDRALRDRLTSLHLIAGGMALGLGLLAALLLAPALARPLRRLTAAARRIQTGDLRTRVQPAGAPELRELAGAFNRRQGDRARRAPAARPGLRRPRPDHPDRRQPALKRLALHRPRRQRHRHARAT